MIEWSDDELQLLLQLSSQGLSWSEIADALANEYEYREYTANCCRKKFHTYHEVDEENDEDITPFLVEASKKALSLSFAEDEALEQTEVDKSILDGLPWTEDEMFLLYSLKKSGWAYPSIAQVLSASYGKRTYTENSCQKKWTSTDWQTFNKEREIKQQLDRDRGDETAEKQRVIEETLAAHERLIRREDARTQIIIDSLKSAIYRLPKPKPTDIALKPSTGPYSYEHMGLLLSDLHVGAKYTLEETGGLGEYNLDIFKSRMKKLKESVIEIATRHRHMYSVPQLHVFCLGDIVAGMNEAGAWSSSYIDMDIFDQSVAGMAALRDALALWAKSFEKVTFYGVFGNHGRVGHKGSHKYSSNWDRVTYSFVQESMREYDNVEFRVPSTWWLYETIENHTFFISHGDGIRGSLGVPYYGVERTQSRVSGLLPTKPNYTLIGHFHSANELSTNFGKVLMNGSFMGGDMYSLKELSRADKPEQKLFGIHHKKGITWSYNIHLDEG